MAVFAPAYPGAIGGRSRSHHWLLSSVATIILMILFYALSGAFQSSPVSCSPPGCSSPPPQPGKLSLPARYTSSAYGFSLNYPTGTSPSQTTSSSIAWQGTLSDGSEVAWSFIGTSASGRSPQQIVNSAQSANYPDAQVSYTIPGANLGYTPGYGNVYDVSVAPGNGQATQDRLIVVASIRKNVAVVLIGIGPYQQSTPSQGSHPNPAETPLVDLGSFQETMNSVTWPGQPPL